MAETKRCMTCGETKQLDNFARRSDRPCGRRSVCKSCDAAKARDYYARKKAARPAEPPRPRKGRTSPPTKGGWANGSTTAWRKLRAAVLERDEYQCRLRLFRCLGRADSVHHTKPWFGRPEDTPAVDLVSACRPCNWQAGSPVDVEPEYVW